MHPEFFSYYKGRAASGEDVTPERDLFSAIPLEEEPASHDCVSKMTKRLLCALGCLLVSSVLPASGFNADHRSYAQMTPDSDAEADSYFGFSVVHHIFPDGSG